MDAQVEMVRRLIDAIDRIAAEVAQLRSDLARMTEAVCARLEDK